MRAEHLQTAIELLEKTVTSRTTSLGPKHPHTVGAQCELANVLCSKRAKRSRFGRWQTISLKKSQHCRESLFRRGYQASTRSRGVAGGDAGRGGDTDAQGTCAAGRCFDRAQGRDAVHDEISVSPTDPVSAQLLRLLAFLADLLGLWSAGVFPVLLVSSERVVSAGGC